MNDVAVLRPSAGMPADEMAVRADLAACYRLVAEAGWDDLSGTHMSAIVPGQEAFLINPFGMLFEEMTASALIKMGLDGEVRQETPYDINRTAFTIHSAVHLARPDVGCVIHLHTPYGMAVSALQEGLLPLTQSAVIVLQDLAYHDFEGVALDLGERERLERDLGERNYMILRNHGTLVMGATIADAFKRMYSLEKVCAAQCMALSGGRPLYPMSAESLAKMAKIRPGGTRSELMWQGLRNRLDRHDPSYRD
jgi:ribulose-5-phosphate 4-epimerase/fuculose-1-phosphate aldolase